MTVLGIFAGGYGKRLMPLTAGIPKSLVDLVDGKNTLDLIIESIKMCGITDIYMMLGAHADKVIELYGDEIEGMTAHYLIEDIPMGTLYSFRSFCRSSEGDAILMNGDIVSDIDMVDFLSRSKRSPFIMDMVVKKMRSPYGIVNVTGDKVLSFEEKPLLPVLMNAGIYHLKGTFRDYAGYVYEGKNVEETVFSRIAEEGRMGAIYYGGFHASLDGLKDLDEIRAHLSKDENQNH